MIASLLLGAAVTSKKSLLILLASNVLYFGYFFYAYIYSVYIDPDPITGIIFLFIGVLSLPVMLP